MSPPLYDAIRSQYGKCLTRIMHIGTTRKIIVDLLQESGTRTYPPEKQTSYGRTRRKSLPLHWDSSAKHGTAERDLHEKFIVAVQISLLALTGGFKPSSGKNKRLSDAPSGDLSRLKDACTFLPGIFNARTPGKISATRPTREIHFAGLLQEVYYYIMSVLVFLLLQTGAKAQ